MAIAYGGIFTVGTAPHGSDTVNTTGTVTGSNPTLVCFVGWMDILASGAPTVTDCTYNSVSLTYKGRAQQNWGGDNYLTVEAWYMDNPPTGSSYTLEATISEEANTGGIWIIGTWATGANNGLGTNYGTGTGSDDSPTCTFTTGSSDSLIFGAVPTAGADNDPFTPGNGTTEIADGDNGAQCSYFAGYESASGGSDTLDCTMAKADGWAIVAVEVQATAAGDAMPMAVDHYRRRFS